MSSISIGVSVTAGGVLGAAGSPPASWSITDNGDGTFTIASAPAAPGALTITDNGDGTFDAAA